MGLVLRDRINFLHRIIEENPEFFEKLPKTEQTLYDLYIVRKINQKEIARFLGKTQGAISSRLKKISNRLLFMEKLKVFDVSKIRENFAELFGSFEIELLKGMLETTCQSETARRLNIIFGCNQMNQIRVRSCFEKCLTKMKKINHPYYELFFLIKKNLYLLHEVKLPHYNNR